ncbi:MAG: Ig-like domain-containing protein, partial [Elusimicrobiota bacterium]
FDVHVQTIMVIGVTNGQSANANLAPVVTIADFSQFTATVTLNGQPFAGSATLTLPGTYFLSAQAADAFGNASSATVSFTIDKSSPTLVLLSPPNGLLTNQNVLVTYQTADDFTPAGQIVVKDEFGSVVPSSYTITVEGARNLTLTARDLAGNAASAGAVFILDKTPPAAVADLRVTAKNPAAGQATLSWTSPHDALSGVAGYVVKAAAYPLTAANFDAEPTVAVSTTPSPEGAAEQFVVSVATFSTVYFAQKSSDAAGNLSAISNIAFWDLDGPVLSGLNPASGATISRPTTILLQASDLTGVSRIAFSVDGVVLSTSTAAPYSFPWNTLAYADGAHALRFDALDVVGNPSSLSAGYTLAYQPPPAPVIVSPAGSYATVTATVAFTGTAVAGITVQILLNSFPLVSGVADTTGRFSLVATLPSEGTFALSAAASDAKGTGAPSAAVSVYYNKTAPNPPAALDAATLPGGHIGLTWQAPAGKIPSSYNVYRNANETALSSGVVPSPSLRVKSGVTGTAADDLPPQDGLFYYGVTSLDLSGNESGLSNVAPGASDRVIPTAAVAFLDTTPPLGPGTHSVRLTLSKILAAPPLLTFTPNGQGPLTIALTASSPTVWVGTLTVASAMASGTGAFAFEGMDFAGNVGHAITSGGTSLLDTTPPSGSVVLNPASPVKAGPVALTLTVSEPVPAAPSLSYILANGATVPVTLAGGPSIWTSTLTIAPGTGGTANFVFSATDALGNSGSILTGTRNFVIDTTAPGAPTLLHAVSREAGVIALTWSAPLDGTPASYSVWRDGVRISSGLTPLALGAGAFNDLPPADGTYTYAVSAMDAAGNEGALSGATMQISRRTPPPAPASFVAQLNAFNRIELSWQAASTETPSGYNFYRSTSAITALAGIVPTLVSLPPVTDTPASNGLYYYAVTAIDFAGNESPAFATAQFLWDNAPPVITITGVQNGRFYNNDLNTAYVVSDPALATATVQGQLDGTAFLSGAVVSVEGAHVLTVTGTNQAGVGSTATVHFTL